MRFLAWPLLLLLGGPSSAEDRPQFVWQGEVEGIVLLRLHGDRLHVQAQGPPVARQQYRFNNPLPDQRTNARLEVREGRGFVHILDQPRLENDYTLAISIEDRQAGSAFYSIAVYWEASDQAFERHRGRTGKLVWTGRVDEEALISCHDKTCTTSSARGAPVADARFKFSRALPHREVDVSLQETEGRGEIRLVEQPRSSNNYTAIVSIRDPQSGSSEYSFVLAWREPSGKAPQAVIVPDRGLVWTAVISGRVRVAIQGRSTISEMLPGASLAGEHADFFQSLPARSDLKPTIKILRGPGTAEIVEYPSDKNNYRLVFEINDSGTAASSYEIEVDW